MLIDDRLLDGIEGEAAGCPRLRMNFNLHDSLEAKAQRLVNVLMPGTVIPIHRHGNTSETYVLLRGKLEVMFYDDDGMVKERFLLDVANGNYGVHIPKGQWHGLNVLEPSAILEVKDGPYSPIAPEDILAGA